jgi:hypothetical protein
MTQCLPGPTREEAFLVRNFLLPHPGGFGYRRGGPLGQLILILMLVVILTGDQFDKLLVLVLLTVFFVPRRRRRRR